MFEKKRQCFIPHREVNWKKYAYLHNRENNIFYDCECGKRYISFPAIYLHFQRKHHKKLATKFDSNQCEIRKNEKQSIYFYYSSTKRHQPGKQIQKESNNTETKCITLIGSTLLDFAKQEQQLISQIIHTIDMNKILLNLEKFVLSIENSKSQNIFSQSDLLYELPYYFNDFVWAEMRSNKKVTKQSYGQICCLLDRLAKWLNHKNFSDLIVEFNNQSCS